jgi:hypothetical protein
MIRIDNNGLVKTYTKLGEKDVLVIEKNTINVRLLFDYPTLLYADNP